MLASPRFQSLATRFPLTRPVARRHAKRLFDLVAAFTYSQTLFACVELDLFARLADGPRTLADLAHETGLSGEAMHRLAGAAAAIGLLDLLPNGRMALGVSGAALVANPGALAMIAHHDRLYADLADPVALLRRGGGGGALAKFWAYARDSDADAVSPYSALMAASQPPVAAELLHTYSFRRHRRMLDVGGGEGGFVAEIARHVPTLEIGLVDLPSVIERTRTRLGDKAQLYGRDILNDSLPAGYDLITLIRVLHDHDDVPAARLLRAIHAALPPGGRLLIGEPMAEAVGAETVGPTYFGWYLLAMGSGRARAPAEIGSMLKAAGFAHWRQLHTRLPLTTSAIIATRL